MGWRVDCILINRVGGNLPPYLAERNFIDIKKIIRAREISSTRLAHPSKVFFDTFMPCISAAEAILAGDISKHGFLIERASIICTVTAIEVYFRDILELVFKYCAPEYFGPLLRDIAPR